MKMGDRTCGCGREIYGYGTLKYCENCRRLAKNEQAKKYRLRREGEKNTIENKNTVEV